MERDRIFEEVIRVNTKARKASLKVVKKMRLQKSILGSFTEEEKETEGKAMQLVYALEDLTFAYKYVCNDKVPEVRAAVENAVLVTCKGIEKLVENLKV